MIDILSPSPGEFVQNLFVFLFVSLQLGILVFSVFRIIWHRDHNLRLYIGLAVISSFSILGLLVASTELLVATPPLGLQIRDYLTFLSPFLGTLVGAALAIFFLSRINFSIDYSSRRVAGVLVILATISIFVLAGIGLAPSLPEIRQEVAPRQAYVNFLRRALPEGFLLEEVVPENTFDGPSSMTLGPMGEVYVGTRNGIFVGRDLDSDGTFDEINRFARRMDRALGLAYHDDALYAARKGNVYRIRDVDGDMIADYWILLHKGLPHNVFNPHSNNGMAIGPDDKLYMAVGGTTDHGPEEHPLGGTILVSELTQRDPEVFARGLRNSYDLAFCSDGRLFATDNGPDQLRGEEFFIVPPDELNLVEEGMNYGYPDEFGFPPPWSGSEPPVALLPENGAATGIVCYEGSNFPDEYVGDLFITMWNSQTLINVDLKENEGFLVGEVNFFLDDWENPIDLIVDNDGTLLVLDRTHGQIFRIRYEG